MALEVSVVVPSYNRAHLIAHTLDSILNQTHRPAEVVVVDDGSTDNTETVVRNFGRGVKYLRIENSGPPRARNVGANATTAPWLAFCDSDDLWHPSKLSLQGRLFEKAPDIDYCFTNFCIVVDEQWSTESKFDSLPAGYWDLASRQLEPDLFVVEESMFGRLLLGQPIFPSTVMMKRTFFETAGGWREELGRNPAEDVEFTLRCIGLGPVGVVATPLAGVRKHTSNFSGSALRNSLGHIEVLRFVLKNNPAARPYTSLIEQQILMRTEGAVEITFAEGDFVRTRELLESVPYNSRSWKLHLKAMISHSPKILGHLFRKTRSSFGYGS
jgi:GT2 family glycosyltransferase